MTLEELKALYAEKGATTQRAEETEQGTQWFNDPVVLADGWSAWENAPPIVDYQGQGIDATPIYGELSPEEKLGGFSRHEGNKTYFYDTNGSLVNVQKDTTWWDDLGPIITAAGTGYLSGIPLGDTGLTAANAVGAAKAIDSGNPLGFLSSISGALDQAGVSLDDMSTKDLMKYIGLANTVSGGAISNTLNEALGGGSNAQAQTNPNVATLLSALGGTQQPQVVQTASQDPYAHIKLMEELFGPNIDLTRAEEDTAKRK